MLGNALHYALAFIGALGLLILFHELGHYWVARWCGVKVIRFSIGFGRPLISMKRGKDQTEWVICALPLGGYVRMLDEHEANVPEVDLPRAFNRQPLAKRSAIVAAGPIANLLLAFVIYVLVFWQGSMLPLPILGTPELGTPAEQAGIRNGDQILTVNGRPVKTWHDFRWLLLKEGATDQTLVIQVSTTSGELVQRSLVLPTLMDAQGPDQDPLFQTGLRFYQPEHLPKIGKVMPDGAAARAGLRVGDDVLSVGVQPVDRWLEFVKIVRESPGKPLNLLVLRDGQTLHITVTPEIQDAGERAIGRIGVGVAEDPNMPQLNAELSYSLPEALLLAGQEVWEKSLFSLKMMGKMLLGQVSWKNLSGPMTIADYAGQTAKVGFDAYFKFLALLSISLGVLNLLPIPVLDGGHLMYHAIEAIKGSPVSDRALAIGQRIGMALIGVLMAFAIFNDLSRLFLG